MEILPLPEDSGIARASIGGIARASIGGIEHFRAIDVAKQQFPDSVAGAAVKIYVERHSPSAHMVYSLLKTGRYLPRADLPIFIDTLNDPETAKVARARVFGGMANRKRERQKRMNPIRTVQFLNNGKQVIMRLDADDLPASIRYTRDDGRLLIHFLDALTLMVPGANASSGGGYRRGFMALEPTPFTPMLKAGGRPAYFFDFADYDRFVGTLTANARNDQIIGRIKIRMTQVDASRHGTIPAASPEPDAADVVSQVMGGIPDMPAVEPPPVAVQPRRSAAEVLAELRKDIRTDRERHDVLLARYEAVCDTQVDIINAQAQQLAESRRQILELQTVITAVMRPRLVA